MTLFSIRPEMFCKKGKLNRERKRYIKKAISNIRSKALVNLSRDVIRTQSNIYDEAFFENR